MEAFKRSTVSIMTEIERSSHGDAALVNSVHGDWDLEAQYEDLHGRRGQ